LYESGGAILLLKSTRKREGERNKTKRLSASCRLAQSVVAQISSGSKEKSSNFFFFISVKQKIFSENFTKKQKIPPTSKKGAPFFFPRNSKKYGSS
jgi:hypothetical protein